MTTSLKGAVYELCMHMLSPHMIPSTWVLWSARNSSINAGSKVSTPWFNASRGTSDSEACFLFQPTCMNPIRRSWSAPCTQPPSKTMICKPSCPTRKTKPLYAIAWAFTHEKWFRGYILGYSERNVHFSFDDTRRLERLYRSFLSQIEWYFKPNIFPCSRCNFD